MASQQGTGICGNGGEPESASQIFVSDDRAPASPPIAHGLISLHQNICLTWMRILFPLWVKGLRRYSMLAASSQGLPGPAAGRNSEMRMRSPEVLQGAFQIGSLKKKNQMVPRDDNELRAGPGFFFFAGAIPLKTIRPLRNAVSLCLEHTVFEALRLKWGFSLMVHKLCCIC